MEIVGYLLTGAAAAAVVKLIDNLIMHFLNRKAKKQDDKASARKMSETDEAKWKQHTDDMIENLVVGVRVILMDRIRHLGRRYLSNGEVDFDDRRLLNMMHGVYHQTLSGNGDLDNLMKQVNELPLKHK